MTSYVFILCLGLGEYEAFNETYNVDMAADSPKKSVKSNYNVTRPQAFR